MTRALIIIAIIFIAFIQDLMIYSYAENRGFWTGFNKSEEMQTKAFEKGLAVAHGNWKWGD